MINLHLRFHTETKYWVFTAGSFIVFIFTLIFSYKLYCMSVLKKIPFFI